MLRRASHDLVLAFAFLLAFRPGLVSAADPLPAPPPHHRDGHFQNNYLAFEPKGLGALLKWRIEAARQGVPHEPATATPRVAADPAFLRANAGAGAAMEPALTWIGHASTLVQMGGSTLLTDPIFSERASPLAFLARSAWCRPDSRSSTCRTSTPC